jgi:hypothetical protein
VRQVLDVIAHPALTDVSILPTGGTSLEPSSRGAGDLLVGYPVLLTARYSGNAPSGLLVTAHDSARTKPLQLIPIESTLPGHYPIATVWGREKLAEMAVTSKANQAAELRDMQKIALDYGLLWRLTGYVMVDATTVTPR